MSLRQKVALGLLVFLGSAMLLMGLQLNQVLQSRLLQQLQEELLLNARLIDSALRTGAGGDPEALAREFGGALGARVTLIDGQGVVLGDSDARAAEMEQHAGRPEVRVALGGQVGRDRRFSRTIRSEMEYLAYPARGGSTIAVIRVARPISQIQAVLGEVRRGIILTTLLVLSLYGLASVLIAGRMVKPLQEMAQVASAYADGRFSSRILVGGEDEIGVLARSLEEMADRLSEQFQQIQQEEGRLRAVLHALEDGVVVLDSRNRVVLANQAAARFLDLDEVPVGQVFSTLTRDPSWQGVARKVLYEGASVSEEETKPNGLTILIQGIPVPLGGDRSGAVLVLRDLSEIRGLEQMRREFVSNVSHELRTPLTSIQGFTETLLDGAAEDPSLRERFLKVINQETIRLTKLISDLLGLSRIESKKVELHLEEVSLDDLQKDVLELMGAQAQAKGVSLSGEIPRGLPTLWADEDLLKQALLNLVENAIKYTPAGGRVSLGAEVSRESLRIWVEDTGVGIPPEHLPRLFERFYRVDKARSRSLGGTGLGLSIVKHITERHGGRVTVTSGEGVGSSFSLHLPRVREEMKE